MNCENLLHFYFVCIQIQQNKYKKWVINIQVGSRFHLPSSPPSISHTDRYYLGITILSLLSTDSKHWPAVCRGACSCSHWRSLGLKHLGISRSSLIGKTLSWVQVRTFLIAWVKVNNRCSGIPQNFNLYSRHRNLFNWSDIFQKSEQSYVQSSLLD